jgi:hypothetical protein
VEFRKASDNSVIASRTGPGSFAIAPANVGVSAYFVRLSGGNTVMSTITSPVTLTTGVNPDVPLYAGAEVQVAQAARIELLPTLAQIEASAVLAKEATVATRASQTSVDAIPTNPLLATDARLNNLDATVSSRLASSAYTEPTTPPTAAAIRAEIDASSTKLDVAVSTRLATSGYTAPPTLAEIRADIERTGGMLDAVPTLAEVEASTVLAKQSGFTDLATGANVTAAQTAIVAEINANEGKIDTLQTAATAIKAKTDQLVFTAGNVNAIAQVVSDKTGYALTSAERTAIANAVQGAILDENDGQAILAAIVAAIGNTNISQTALVAAIRADLERANGMLDALPSAAEAAAAVLAAQVEPGATLQQSLRLHNAVLGGKASGGGTGVETFRDLADTADRVVAEVDAAGNRVAITRSL